ncbi:MAG: sulfur transferase domain-containing protein [Polyangiaceae bacterium]
MDLPQARRETPLLTTAGQPAASDFAALRAAGFDAVVNISTPSARNYLADEATHVLAEGLLYIHAPVDCTALEPGHFALVSGALRAFAGKRVLLHCAGNVKASAMAHVHRVRELHEDAAALRADLKRQDWHEPKWYRYFDAMGA